MRFARQDSIRPSWGFLFEETTVSAQVNTHAEQADDHAIAAALAEHGAWFTGVDIAYPWIIEVNVVNPGGIATINDLTGIDLSARLASIANAALLR